MRLLKWLLALWLISAIERFACRVLSVAMTLVSLLLVISMLVPWADVTCFFS